MRMLLSFVIFAFINKASSSNHNPTEDMIMYNLRIWVGAAAHCAESSRSNDYNILPGEIDQGYTNECMRCWSQVGMWGSEEGSAKGNQCLATYEPEFVAMCGELMAAWYVDQTIEKRDAVDDCWEVHNLKRIAIKCIDATGGGKPEMELLCINKHLSENMIYAREKAFGERYNLLDPPQSERDMERVLEEGRCEHANIDNIERRTECNMCFGNVRKQVDNLRALGKKHNFVQGDSWDASSITFVRRLTALWMFCADNYLAPVYSECFKDEPALRDAIENFDVQNWKEVVQNMKACTFIKASEHFFADCKDGTGNGVDGLISYVLCSQKKTRSWVSDRRPEARDIVEQYFRGGSNAPSKSMEEI